MAGAGAGAVGFPRDLMVQRIQSLVEEGFWDALRRLKLDVLGTDDSPIPITGYYTPRQRRPMASFFNLRSGSLVPPSHNSVGDRNNCPVPGTLINTNNMRGFQNLDREQLLKAEAKKILLDIVSGKVEEDPSVLLRFLVTSFADLKNWKVYYNVAFPSLVFNSRMTLLNLQPASKVLTKEEAASMYTSLQKWRASSETTVIPFFLVSISSDSSASIRQLKDWKACQGNYQKLLFGFYDHGCRSDCPGWVIRNYVAFLSIRWKIEKVQFFCYREYKGNPDLEQSLIVEASFPSPCGWDDADFLPDAIGWEGINSGKRTKEMKPKEIDLQSMNPASQDEEKQLMHLKLMGWRHFPVNIEKLSHVRVLLLGAGTLGCEVARLLMTWGVRKLTVVDSNSVATSDLVKQSLYIDKDCGVPRVAAIVPHLKDRCPAVEVEGIQMEIPVPGHPVSSSNVASVLDDCKHLQTLVAANDAVFLLTDTWDSRWLPTLLCASENKIAISVVLGCDSYLVMRHGAGPGTSGGTDEVITQIENLSTEDALGHQRLGCCFCNDAASLINPIPYGTLPGLTSVASGKAVELFARMLHHPDEIHAPGDTARMETEHQLGLLPHQLRGSLPECVLSMELSNSLVNCTACSVAVLSEYRRRGLDFVMQAINYPTYLKDFTGISDLKRPDTCPKIPASISVNSDKISDVRCLLLGAGTLGCDVARILMDCGVWRLTVVDSGRVVVSNLARQSLYTSDDRGAPKATAILRHLVERCPSVDAQGVKMEIPMPGHPVSPGEAAGVLQDCERLKELVASHDAIFLLTDTRESRWLPTLLCTNENKIAITAALGYDSYLVMRHGAGPGISCEASNAATAMDKLSTEDALGRQRLGCYFCNDVIAPVDSVSNRTLDQQCTVTRPGLASIASGRAADLFRRMLYHPDGIHASGEIAGTGSSHEHGLLPHQMRGSLSQYNLLTLLGYSSSNCTACSNAVLSEYRRRGMDFVMQVINEPTYLEDLTGLTDLMKSTSYSQVEWVDDTDEDDFIEVTKFTCGGFAVGICFSHLVFDGQGAAQFLKAVGEMARGLPEPSIKPIWARDAIPNPPKPPLGPPPSFTAFNFEKSVVEISLDSIKRVKDQVANETNQKCSTFDVVTAIIFKCRALAVDFAPDAEVRLGFAASTRHLLSNVLPSVEGYYGNCVYPGGLTKTSQEVKEASLVEIVTAIREAKEALSSRFLDWLSGGAKENHYNVSLDYGTLVVTDWSHVGFNEVDYGFGEPSYVFTLNDDVNIVPSVVYLKPPKPKQGIRLVLQCVEGQHSAVFSEELQKHA